jgi:diadenosine tetraphosphatase ApaH/serine/threonine PP2A family protein phosphatase
MLAFVSDIHSNLEALLAVLSAVDKAGASEIICLGDVVGYGPNPKECIDLVAKDCALTVMGNHDQATLFATETEGFNLRARRAIIWTRAVLEDPLEKAKNDARWEYLGKMPPKVKDDGLLFVHGSARRPINEYVFPEDIHNKTKMEKIFAGIKKMAFQGHTHLPGVFTESGKFFTPVAVGNTYKIDDEKVMVNVGAVGQPRDGNPRASFATFDGKQVEFRRVSYDMDKTIEKIYAIRELDNYLGDRLRLGR